MDDHAARYLRSAPSAPASVRRAERNGLAWGDRPDSVSVILVAFESAHVIGEALDSVGDGHEVICVDNASKDKLADLLAGRGITCLRNEDNLGFSRACNQGAKLASSEFLLFMNPDVVLAKGAIETLVEAARKYDDADVFAPRTLRPSGALWFHDISSLEHRTLSRSYWQDSIAGDCCTRFVDGGVFLIRRSTFMALGGFDEGIFLYFEDDDLTLRLLQSGKTIIHVNEAVATHRLGQSTKKSLGELFMREYHKKRSEYYVKAKYGVPVRLGREYRATLFKLIYYVATLRVSRATRSLGRLSALSALGVGRAS